MPGERARVHTCPRSVGVLGLPPMAVPLVGRLRQRLPVGTQLTVFESGQDSASRSRVAEATRLGARAAASPADLAARSAVVLVLLDGVDALEHSLGGPSGLQAGVHSPTTLVVSGTAAPDRLREIAARLTLATVGLMRVADAPLSGSLSDAADGRLSIMVGASTALFAELRPLLELIGRPVSMGAVGAGQQAYACEQLLVGATMVALAEASLIAERSGLDLGLLLTGWQSSMAGSRVLDNAREGLVHKVFDLEVPAARMSRGLAVAVVEAGRTSVSLDLLEPVAGFFDALDKAGLADHDLTAAYELLARRNRRTDDLEAAADGSRSGGAVTLDQPPRHSVG